MASRCTQESMECLGKLQLDEIYECGPKKQLKAGELCQNLGPKIWHPKRRKKPSTWWFIPLSKWIITPVISGLTLLIPFITGVITHLLSGMGHQEDIKKNLWRRSFCRVFHGHVDHEPRQGNRLLHRQSLQSCIEIYRCKQATLDVVGVLQHVYVAAPIHV